MTSSSSASPTFHAPTPYATSRAGTPRSRACARSVASGTPSAAAGEGPPALRARLERQRELFDAAGDIEWEEFLPLADEAGAAQWDVLSIATAAVESDKSGLERLINFDESGVQAWAEGRSARLWEPR